MMCVALARLKYEDALLGIVCLHELLAFAIVVTYAWNSYFFLLVRIWLEAIKSNAKARGREGGSE